MRFSPNIRTSFLTGFGPSKNSLRNRSYPTAPLVATPPLAAPAALRWQPLPLGDAPRPALQLYFVPHLTVSAEAGPQRAEYVAMLYLDAPAPDGPAADTSSLGNLASGLLAWTLNALLSSGTAGRTYPELELLPVTADDLRLLLCVFDSQPDSAAPFNYANPAGHDARTFLQQFFSISIVPPASNANDLPLSAAVFPPFPELQLQTVYNGVAAPIIDFAQQSMTGDQHYLTDLMARLRAQGVSYETSRLAGQPGTSCAHVDNSGTLAQPNLSLPTRALTDYLALLAKSMVQHSLDFLTATSEPVTVGELLAGVRTPANTAGLADRASRFLLHGLRLPTPPLAATGAVQPFYALTGQQVALPATLQPTDTYTVQLLKASAAAWLAFGTSGGTALPITLDAAEITRIMQTAGLPLAPALLPGYPRPLVNFHDQPQAFTLGSPARWHYPASGGLGAAPHLLQLPGSLQAELTPAHADLTFALQALDTSTEYPLPQPVQQYQWATTVRLTIQKLKQEASLDSALTGNVYSLVGTDDVGVSFLQHLVAYLHPAAGQQPGTVHILYPPDPTSPDADGYLSALPTDELALAIVKANLSTATTPAPSRVPGAGVVAVTGPDDALKTFTDFVTLLWECSLGRSGGYYLYYDAVGAGRAGLPDELFDANGVATVQVLITYPQFLAQPFVNSVVIGDALPYTTTVVYAQADALTVRAATLQPGCVGYELQRPAPGDYSPASLPVPPQEDKAYFENQFNLLGATLPGVPQYQNLLPSGPLDSLDATGRGSDDVWQYRGVIPYYQFVQPASPLHGFADPYAGVGSTVTMLLNWQDMFGNMLPFATGQGTVSTPLLYTDPLLAVSQWPSASVSYAFGGTSASPEVQLTFGFNTARYQGSEAQHNAAIDLQTWMRLWFQLQHAADLSFSLTSSLDGTAASPQGTVRPLALDQLQSQFVRPVIDYLYGLASAGRQPGEPPLLSYKVSSAIAPASITTYTHLFPLVVSLTLSRTQNLAPNFATTPGVQSTTTAVQPLATAAGSAAQALTEFATQFEDLFNTTGPVYLKVATTTNLSAASSTATATPPIWLVRLDTSGQQGISVQYQHDEQGSALAAYYAPIPLATSLQAVAATVYAYTSGQPYPGQGTHTTYAGIDLDSWGQQFLEAVDRFLLPRYAVPAFLLDNGQSLQTILAAKQRLAEAITGTVDCIIASEAATEQANVRNAQEKWLQQLLMQLGSAYACTAAVQTPVTVHSCWSGPNQDPLAAGGPPRLYGQLVGTPGGPAAGAAPEEFTLSTAKLPIGQGNSWLTYLFQCRNPGDFASFDFDAVQFALTHIEWQYEEVVQDANYLGSSWLALVLPQALPASFTAVGPVQVPVPLRAYPTSPSVTQQQAHNPSATQPAGPVLAARSWDYQFTYQTASANQDTVATQVQLNVEPATATHLLATLSLPEALAQFINTYPAISQDFDHYLAQVTGATTTGPAWLAVQAFSHLVEQVAAAWLQHNQVHSLKPRLLAEGLADTPPTRPATVVLNYQVEESAVPDAATGQERLLVTVTAADNKLPQLLAIDIEGYERQAYTPPTPPAAEPLQAHYCYTVAGSAPPQYLLFADRRQVPARQATVPALDILNQQNGRAGLAIIRNQNLLPRQPTNPRFIYQTPLVMFPSPLTPLFDPSGTLDSAQLPAADGAAPAPRSLAANLAAVAAALTEHVDAASVPVQVECQYAYALPNGLRVTLPVLLAPPSDLTTADHGAAFATGLTTALDSWQQQQPSEQAAQWLLSVNIFSAFGAGPPILTLSFSLSLADIG